MIVKKEFAIIFALLTLVAVSGCGDDSPAGESSAGAKLSAGLDSPGGVENRASQPTQASAIKNRLLPKGLGLLANSVKAAGGRTLVRPETGIVMVQFEGVSLGDAELSGLKHLEIATVFRAPDGQITDEGLAQLASEGQRIKTLELSGNPITDAGLTHLRQMKSLTFVALDRTEVTSSGVEELRTALPNLKIGFFP